MKNFKLVVALLISIAFGTVVVTLHERNRTLVRKLNQNTQELNQKLSSTQTELKQLKIRLAVAENKLGFLSKNKTAVQVTAYTRVESPSSFFANGGRVNHAYAVSNHRLPEDHMIYVALSPTAQSKLHARMNDYIVLIHKRSERKTIARFVDLMPSEKRPVVDVFFSDQRQATIWGRREDYYAVNISSVNSPFKRVLGR